SLMRIDVLSGGLVTFHRKTSLSSLFITWYQPILFSIGTPCLVHSPQSFLGKRRRCEDPSHSGRGFPCTPFPKRSLDFALKLFGKEKKMRGPLALRQGIPLHPFPKEVF